MTPDPSTDPGTPKPTAAGIYDAILGGSHHTDAERALVAELERIEPELRAASWANRGFLQRAAGWMAGQGIRRFIDIGAGLPTMSNTHEVVRRVDPGCRVTYVDKDPETVRQGRQLLAGIPDVTYLQQDFTGDDLLADPTLADALRAGEPMGLLLVGLLYFIPDDADPAGLVRRWVDALPAGSYLALSHAISDQQDERAIRTGTDEYRRRSAAELFLRSRAEVATFLAGLEIVPPYPGAAPELTFVGLWGAEDARAADDAASRWYVAAVGRKR